jgi:natural product precursor
MNTNKSTPTQSRKPHLIKKLALNKETIRALTDSELAAIAGGVTRNGCGTNTCDTCMVINCERSGNCVTTGLTTIIY